MELSIRGFQDGNNPSQKVTQGVAPRGGRGIAILLDRAAPMVRRCFAYGTRGGAERGIDGMVDGGGGVPCRDIIPCLFNGVPYGQGIVG